MDTLLNTLRETMELLPPCAVSLTGVVLLALLAVVADLVAKRQLVRIVRGISRRSKHTWDDALVQHRVFGRFAQILPALVFYFGLELVPGLRDGFYALAQALERVRRGLNWHLHQVIDLDLKSYFDTVRHDLMLEKLARRIRDRDLLWLCKAILKSGGKRGLPQGSVIGPLWSNVFLNDVYRMLEQAQEIVN